MERMAIGVQIMRPMRVVRAVQFALALAAAMAFALRVSASGSSATPIVTRGPALGNLTQTSVTLVWQTDLPIAGTVHYGIDLPNSFELSSTVLTTSHALTLTGLLPGTRYFYAIFDSAAPAALTGGSFETSPNGAAPFSFAVLGDSGVGSVAQYAIAGLLQRLHPAFVLMTGDIVYPAGANEDYDAKFFAPYSRTLPSVPFFPSLGNHDYGTQSGQPYLDNFFLPSNNPLDTERYYSFDYGSAHFVALDSNLSGSAFDDMLTWLHADLTASSMTWKVVYFHHAIYSSGPHGLDSYVMPLRDRLGSIFEQDGVDLVFNGHDHDYERTLPMHDYQPGGRGVVYIVTGGGGAPLYTQASTHTWSARYVSAWHAVQVTVQGCHLSLSAIEPIYDVAFDTYVLHRCSNVYLPLLFNTAPAAASDVPASTQ